MVVEEQLERDRTARVHLSHEAARDAPLAHFRQNGGPLLLRVALEEHLPQSVPASREREHELRGHTYTRSSRVRVYCIVV